MSCEMNKAMECPCTYTCERNGQCCACVANHLNKGGFPACFFSKEGEALHDRSYEALQKDRASQLN